MLDSFVTVTPLRPGLRNPVLDLFPSKEKKHED